MRATTVYEAAAIGAPYVLGTMLRTREPLIAAHVGIDRFTYHTAPIAGRNYLFPHVQVDNLADIDFAIRPVCDQAHQLFGLEGSPSFNHVGAWIGL